MLFIPGLEPILMADKKTKRKSELENEIEIRLELGEEHVEEMRRRWRALPVGHEARPVLLRQLEVAAAICSELQSLLSLNNTSGPGILG